MPHATANRIRPSGRKFHGHNGEVRKCCVTAKHTDTDGKGSSSEYSANNAVNLNVDATDTGDDYGFNWNNNKDNTNDNNRVRPVLAFRWKCFLTRFFLNNMTEQEIIKEQQATGINYLMRVGLFYHIDSKKHAQLTLLLVRIGKQATAWKNRYSACGKTSTTAPIALGAPSPSS